MCGVSDRNWYKHTQAHYERRALVGWILFAIFVVGAMLFWGFETFFLSYLRPWQWIVILLASFVASLFLHLRAYARAIVDAGGELAFSNTEL